MVKRFEVYWVDLNPTLGSEINKIRPAVIISPDCVHNNLRTVIIAPLTSTIKEYPTRVELFFKGKNASIALDQLRCIDKQRLKGKMGKLQVKAIHSEISKVLTEMFE